MNEIAVAKSSPRPLIFLWMGLACGFFLVPAMGRAAHGYYSGGPGWHSGYRGGFTYTPDCSYIRPYYFNNYSHFPYPTFGNYSYGAGYPYRNYYLSPAYPRPEPRIYVFPQNHGNACRTSGPRVMNVISMPPRHIDEIYPRTNLEEEEEGTVPTVPMIPLVRPSTPEQAWEQLQDGNARSALSAFAGLASGNPEEGLYKIGYGLAAALNGDKITAAYALRRVFEDQPGSAAYAPIAGMLKERLAGLGVEYRQWVAQDPGNMNARFLYAVISHFQHEDDAARACIEESLERGDTSASMASLEKVVNQYLADRQEDGPGAVR